jgi:hypothetical protein
MYRLPLWILILGICVPPMCRADLTATPVTGSATLPPSTANEFDPAVLPQPSYCGKATTVFIGNPNPFNYDFCAIFTPAGAGTGAPPAIGMVAAFTGKTLTIQVSLGTQSAWTPFQMTFTDSAFAGMAFVMYTNNFLYAPDGTPGISAWLSGTTITITGGVPPVGGVYNAAFSIVPPTSAFIAPPDTFDFLFASPVIAWAPVAGAQAYAVWVGSPAPTFPGGPFDPAARRNIFNSWTLPPSQTSMTLPITWLSGSSVAVWSEVNNVWNYVISYPGGAVHNLLGPYPWPESPGYLGLVQWENLVYPLDGDTNVDPFKPFTWIMHGWHDGSNLIIGSTPGASDVFNSGTLQDTQLPHPVPGGSSLPVTGLEPNTTYYARLTGPAGWNTPTDVKFTTGVGKAHLIFPADEAQQVASGSATFTINPVQGALQYVLWLGTNPGGNDVLQGWSGSGTSLTIQLYPNHIYYARMWTQLASGAWTYVDSRYSTFATDVAFLSFPANGELHALAANLEVSGIPRDAIALGWNPISDATGYTLWVGTSPMGNDVLDTYQYVLSNNMDTATVLLAENTTYYVTLWTQKGSQWYATQSVLSTWPQTPASQYGEDPQ